MILSILAGMAIHSASVMAANGKGDSSSALLQRRAGVQMQGANNTGRAILFVSPQELLTSYELRALFCDESPT